MNLHHFRKCNGIRKYVGLFKTIQVLRQEFTLFRLLTYLNLFKLLVEVDLMFTNMSTYFC